MSQPFTMRVPAADPYLALASEVASKYAELAGGTGAHGEALASSLSAAAKDVSSAAGPDGVIDLAFSIGQSAIQVTVRCGAQSTVVSQTITPPGR